MTRYVTKTLFNKNHIKITSTNTPSNPKERKIRKETGGSYYSYSPENTYNRRVIVEKEEIKCESPLGFYYTKIVRKPTEIEKRRDVTNTANAIYFILSKQTYILTYFSKYGENSIGSKKYSNAPSEDGLRPWELCPEDKSMPDHFITDLFNLLEQIFDECRYEKISKIGNGKENLSEFRSSLYQTIFGNKKGPRKQTDEEKILAHGFDLKESFRKPKENGK